MPNKPIPFKTWLMEEAQRTGLTYEGVYRRYQRGLYPGLKLRRVNARVIEVLNPEVSGQRVEVRGE